VVLTILEIVLGIDNLVFISIITARLPAERQKHARQIGLALACLTRLALLATINWIAKMTYPLLTVFGQAFSWRDLILIGGGLFLLAKSTTEIHVDVAETPAQQQQRLMRKVTFVSVIVQIIFLDIIFSLDSVITAIGLAQEFFVMASAIIIAVLLMIWASEPLSRFIHAYPSLKMLALSFLLLVGVFLIADGFGFHMPRGYLYFAIAFSLLVEVLNIVAGRRRGR
jgi:predicted tellurium resistance membrane protein TerC